MNTETKPAGSDTTFTYYKSRPLLTNVFRIPFVLSFIILGGFIALVFPEWNIYPVAILAACLTGGIFMALRMSNCYYDY